MLKRLVTGLMAGMLLVATFTPVQAMDWPDNNGYHVNKRGYVKFDPVTGCWEDRKATDSFAIFVREPGMYLMITMLPLEGMPDKPMGGRKLELTDAVNTLAPPITLTSYNDSPHAVVAKLEEAGNYQLEFGPKGLRGYPMYTMICVSRDGHFKHATDDL